MKNITLSIEEDTLKAGREYAQRHHTTLNALIRELLDRTVNPDRSAASRELIRLMEAFTGDSRGSRWNRSELHER
jgi:hypothetical protein